MLVFSGHLVKWQMHTLNLLTQNDPIFTVVVGAEWESLVGAWSYLSAQAFFKERGCVHFHPTYMPWLENVLASFLEVVSGTCFLFLPFSQDVHLQVSDTSLFLFIAGVPGGLSFLPLAIIQFPGTCFLCLPLR